MKLKGVIVHSGSADVGHYYSIYGGDIKGKKAIVQGFGNVGSAAAFYLAEMGAKIVGIIDRDGGLINENGFSFEENLLTCYSI